MVSKRMTNQKLNRSIMYEIHMKHIAHKNHKKKRVLRTLKVHDGSVIHPRKYAHGASTRLPTNDYFEIVKARPQNIKGVYTVPVRLTCIYFIEK